MRLDVKTLSEYRFARAKEDMEAAVSNHQSGFYNVANKQIILCNLSCD